MCPNLDMSEIVGPCVFAIVVEMSESTAGVGAMLLSSGTLDATFENAEATGTTKGLAIVIEFVQLAFGGWLSENW